MDNLEYRAVSLEDVVCDSEKRIITGRAIVYNSESKELRTTNGDAFKEVIFPDALDESLKNNDILALKEHNGAMILGRTSAGTLRLENRADGLYCSIDIPETTYGNDTLISAKRGDLKGFSFGFRPLVQRFISKAGLKVRELLKLDVREVSIVGQPAYGETTLSCRSEDFIAEVRTEEVKTVATVTETEPVKFSVDMEFYKKKTELYGYQLRGQNLVQQPQTKQKHE